MRLFEKNFSRLLKDLGHPVVRNLPDCMNGQKAARRQRSAVIQGSGDTTERDEDYASWLKAQSTLKSYA